jgi:hypothetical protein
MKTILTISMLVIILGSCANKKEHKDAQITVLPIEVSVIYPQDSIAFVLEGYEDSILNSDYFHLQDETWFFNSEGTEDMAASIPVKIQPLGNLYASLPVFETWDWIKEGKPRKVEEGFMYEYIPNDTIRYLVPYKLWWKAECNKVMPGFNALCMMTFGKHKALGNSMDWTVRQYTVCGPGTSFCLEKKKRVGTIRYYQSRDCSDSLFRSVSIERFTCN